LFFFPGARFLSVAHHMLECIGGSQGKEIFKLQQIHIVD